MKPVRFSKKLLGAVSSLALFSISMGQAGAVVMTFTDQAAWEAALGSATFATENFNGTASSFSANSTGNPIGDLTTLDMNGPTTGSTGPTGIAGNGFFEGRVDGGGPNTLSLTINTPSISGFAIIGLQNDSVQNPAGLDLQQIGIRVEGESFLVTDILSLTDPSTSGTVPLVDNTDPIPFLGFVTMGLVNSFDFIHGDLVRPVTGGAQPFYIDELILAQPSATVPEPSTMLLLASCLAGLRLNQRKNGKMARAI